MSDSDDGLGAGAKIVIGILAILGLFSLVSMLLGWLIGAIWGFIRLAVLVGIVLGVIWIVVAARRA